MGLFSFIKDAGAKLLGLGDAKAATADALTKEVAGHGFDATKLDIKVDGDKVKVSGQAMTQEEAEKIILALGNTVGVSEVDTTGLNITKAGARIEIVHGQEGRHALEDRRRALRQGQGREVHRDRQGQHPAGEESGPHPAGLGPAHSAAGIS